MIILGNFYGSLKDFYQYPYRKYAFHFYITVASNTPKESHLYIQWDAAKAAEIEWISPFVRKW